MTHYSPLLACYGGGHSQIISAVAGAMLDRGVTPTVIGFTTGLRSLQRAGIDARSVEILLEPDDEPFLQSAGGLVGSETHPDVTSAETLAYYALGLRDLVERLGQDKAIEAVQSQGRKAFEPVSIMSRYLRKTRPDIVITTTSPRFESALLKAGRGLGIPTLAIGDLFLVKESEWICQPDYAQFLAVLSSDVLHFIGKAGFPRDNIRVTGNPAFDALRSRPEDGARRARLRQERRLADKTVILWPAPGSAVSMIGRLFQPPEAVISALESLCERHPSLTYIYRSHPNRISASLAIQRGRLDQGDLSAEDALLVADIVCVEASTMGLQAALRGLPVICVGFADYVLYPEFGLAQSANTLSEAMGMIAAGNVKAPSSTIIAPVGASTQNVLAFVEDIISESRKVQGNG